MPTDLSTLPPGTTMREETIKIVTIPGAFEGPHIHVEVPDGRSTVVLKTADGRLLTAQFVAEPGGSPDSVEIRYLGSGPVSSVTEPTFRCWAERGHETVFTTEDTHDGTPTGEPQFEEDEKPTVVVIPLDDPEDDPTSEAAPVES